MQLKRERNKGLTFKNCKPFTECISKINNTHIDNAKDLDIVMLMYNFIEYGYNYSKYLEVYGNSIETTQL